ncbi:MAG TPA: Stp1/IreP family PP2C-type Ser/Thr phosphatase [Spirochaetaceae bacterium]|nr:Stp1/IreP family PP2C-type Ser/Thr phosphatase [Spirochaetaceae bacterium]
MAEVYLATDIGPRRELNEDVVANLGHETYVIADGMGGYAAGEVASRILADTVRDVLAEESSFDEKVLKKAILCGNDAILKKVHENPKYSGMGTTATIFHRENSVIVWAHVGDSRLYLLRNQMLKQITRDHSLVSDLVANGSITQEEARFHPKRNVITRAVGVEAELDVDTGAFSTMERDILMLCSDGLTAVLSDEDICDMILMPPGGENVAERLVRKAIEAGSHDNISAIVVKYD